MKELCFLNGELMPIGKASLPLTDLAILRGYGIFDFFRAIDGKPMFLQQHLDRFERSAKAMHLPIPPRGELETQILTLIEQNAAPTLGIKLIATGGNSLDGYEPAETTTFVLARPFNMPSRDSNLKLMTVKHRRELPEIKSLNYIFPIQTLPQQRAAQANDVLYHFGGYISESSRSNIFIVKNEKLITPKNFVLHGITRQNILEVAKNHFEIEQRAVKIHEIWEADEILMSSSTRRVSRIGQVDNHKFTQTKAMNKIYDLLLEKEKLE
ncbi:MAG: hypothetical protein RL757_455 [Bacteroidota bacterium]|jgi:D-alanine transaminase/branched-chain amino acid aminotransferase